MARTRKIDPDAVEGAEPEIVDIETAEPQTDEPMVVTSPIELGGVPVINPEKAQKIIDGIAEKRSADAQRQLEADAAAKKAFAPAPVEVVDLDDVIAAEALSPEQQQAGVKFWFGEIGILTFPDKTTYHVRGHNAFITDPQLIENLKAFSLANPNAKVFIQ
jgi:hypothetical protein